MEPSNFMSWGHVTLELTFIHSSMERLNKVKRRRKRKKGRDNPKKQRLRAKTLNQKSAFACLMLFC